MADSRVRTSPWAWRVFDTLFRPWMARRVRVHVAGRPGPIEPTFPVVLVANHESWWDGFLLRDVQRRLRPDAPYHAVMLERELRRRPFLRRLGGIGVEVGSVASGRTLLRTMVALRRTHPRAVLAYFPQGTIRPGSPRPLDFRSGVIQVAEVLAPVTVLPVGIRLVSGTTPLQDAFLSVGEPLAVPGPGTLTRGLLEAAVTEELDAIDAFIRAHGERTSSRWPGLHTRLPRARDRYTSLDEVTNWISRN